MAINKEPLLKKCKYLGISPMVMGVSKDTKRKADQGNRKKLSEYGMQLKEKQKLKFIYGVLEKQFYHYFEIAEKQQGQAGTNLITILESRLDNVVFRMGLATTRRESRQLVTHGHFSVNGKRIDIPSYRIKPGDVISLRENSRKSTKFKEIVELTNGRVVPLWLEANKEDFSAKVVRMPVKEDLDYEVEEHLIVELYSK
ncbi:MAG: 30S ribosomal protein S4 [Oscillospiraceae bacterium]|jgi:small subunit ribosomal protein S4|uniref:30S ribosomal protein S4 n=1 Tax=Ruminococcus sp. HUN007 TaxID=1514668 RepID=UPI0005D25C50|nr:30S ribosomal protein S4 [Ruminococcus sp. HUN007]MBP1567778.1 30S ribosomal protein S4 [Oscillospiraceae bacterium]MBP1591546.1 30S ribosomal protein S4 [Oscillospiraceae bacterium]MBQ5988427.1 30S ribosomal protein S4 [Oscillospiraceae bacterium]MBR3024567.1 30S ribosomal protein S4 [Oscillospiraceae bacterium]MBR3537043.1 30S ribosomal protein S4 [Oscillospiraceae bacterium]